MPRFLAALFAILLPAAASAQSTPKFSYGQVPTAAQWNNAFAAKQDLLTFTPLNQSGGTMNGPLTTSPSTVNRAGFTLSPGIAPSNPNNGDFWATSVGLFARAANVTFQVPPLASPTFTGTVTAPTLAITGSGSTGDVSGMSVATGGNTRTLATWFPLLAPLASPTFTGTTTIPALIGTSAASLTRTYAYQNVQTALAYDLTAASTTLAEQAGVFRMTSSTGSAGGVAGYKMALGAEAICNSGSAPCWGMTSVLTTNTGYPLSNIQITHEFDQNNNSGNNCTDADGGVNGTVPCGTVMITGAGSNQVTFGLAVSGNNQIRNGIQFNTGGPISASLRDYSHSVSVYYDSGAHSNGIYLGGTYSSKAFSSPGFSVDGSGNVSGGNVTASANLSTLYAKLTPVTYATVNQQRGCSSANQGLMAYITDSPTAVFNATVTAGGGANVVGIICNGTNFVVH